MAAFIWFARRLLSQNDRLLEKLEQAISEGQRSRDSMDAARRSFEDRAARSPEQRSFHPISSPGNPSAAPQPTGPAA